MFQICLTCLQNTVYHIFSTFPKNTQCIRYFQIFQNTECPKNTIWITWRMFLWKTDLLYYTSTVDKNNFLPSSIFCQILYIVQFIIWILYIFASLQIDDLYFQKSEVLYILCRNVLLVVHILCKSSATLVYAIWQIFVIAQRQFLGCF